MPSLSSKFVSNYNTSPSTGPCPAQDAVTDTRDAQLSWRPKGCWPKALLRARAPAMMVTLASQMTRATEATSLICHVFKSQLNLEWNRQHGQAVPGRVPRHSEAGQWQVSEAVLAGSYEDG